MAGGVVLIVWKGAHNAITFAESPTSRIAGTSDARRRWHHRTLVWRGRTEYCHRLLAHGDDARARSNYAWIRCCGRSEAKGWASVQ